MGDIDWDERAANILQWTADGTPIDLGDQRRFGLVARVPFPTKRLEHHFHVMTHICEVSLRCNREGEPATLVHYHQGSEEPPPPPYEFDDEIDDFVDEGAVWARYAFMTPWLTLVRDLVRDLERTERLQFYPGRIWGEPISMPVGELFSSPDPWAGRMAVFHRLFRQWRIGNSKAQVADPYNLLRRRLARWVPGEDRIGMEHHASICRAVTQYWGPLVALVAHGEFLLRRSFHIDTRRELQGRPPVQTVVRRVVWGDYVIDHNVRIELEFHSSVARLGPERASTECCMDATTFVHPTMPGEWSEPKPIPPGAQPPTTPSPDIDAHIDGLGPEEEARLREAGILSLGDLVEADAAAVSEATGFSVELVEAWIEAAQGVLHGGEW